MPIICARGHSLGFAGTYAHSGHSCRGIARKLVPMERVEGFGSRNGGVIAFCKRNPSKGIPGKAYADTCSGKTASIA